MKKLSIPPLSRTMRAEGESLARFLNDERTEARERVLRLFEACRELQQRASGTPPSPQVKQVKDVSLVKSRSYWVVGANRELAPLRALVNQLLARYRFTLQLPWVVPLEHSPLRAELVPTRVSRFRGLTVRHHETAAVERVLRLAEAGALGYLRTCEMCSRWTMTHQLERQLYCSERCNRRAGKERSRALRLAQREREASWKALTGTSRGEKKVRK